MTKTQYGMLQAWGEVAGIQIPSNSIYNDLRVIAVKTPCDGASVNALKDYLCIRYLVLKEWVPQGKSEKQHDAKPGWNPNTRSVGPIVTYGTGTLSEPEYLT